MYNVIYVQTLKSTHELSADLKKKTIPECGVLVNYSVVTCTFKSMH